MSTQSFSTRVVVILWWCPDMGYQGQGCSASGDCSLVLHSMNLWSWGLQEALDSLLVPSSYSTPRISMYPAYTLCLAFLLLPVSDHASSVCFVIFAGSVSFVLVLVLLWRMSSNPLGLSSGISSSRKPLLVSNPDWHKWHSGVFILLPAYPHETVVGVCFSSLYQTESARTSWMSRITGWLTY